MWVVVLLLLPLVFAFTPAFSEPGFDEKYERDYNIFNPINQYRPDNPLNPINSVDPKNPFNPINRVDPGNPANRLNRVNPNNPFNPINEVNPNTRSILSIATIPTRRLSRCARSSYHALLRSRFVTSIRLTGCGNTIVARWKFNGPHV